MTDQSMIERVAQAIAKECPCVDDARDAARVAIEAMREPTEAMTRALLFLPDCKVNEVFPTAAEVGGIWRTMIDAALSEDVAPVKQLGDE